MEGEGGGVPAGGLAGAPLMRTTFMYVSGSRKQGKTGVIPFVDHDPICNAGTAINVCNIALGWPHPVSLPEAK